MYLYRFDLLSALRSQRRHDPVLRGRRSDGGGWFSHHQVKAAHAFIGQDEAVYQLSFWKSFDALRVNLWAHQDGWVIQRLPENHAGLEGFSRGNDEYLERDAWLYWATLPISANKPDRAPVGIPHEDIEVLHPNGEWLKMSDVYVLTDQAGLYWQTIWTTRFQEEHPIHFAQQQLPTGEMAVLMRQVYGHGPSLLNQGWQQQGLIAYLINEGFVTGDPHAIKWFFALERDEEIMVETLKPFISETRIPGLRGVLDRWRGVTPDPKWQVNLGQSWDFLPQAEVETLYTAFQLQAALLRGKQWSYRHLVMTLEEREMLAN